jgi:hypothetical protein
VAHTYWPSLGYISRLCLFKKKKEGEGRNKEEGRRET